MRSAAATAVTPLSFCGHLSPRLKGRSTCVGDRRVQGFHCIATDHACKRFMAAAAASLATTENSIVIPTTFTRTLCRRHRSCCGRGAIVAAALCRKSSVLFRLHVLCRHGWNGGVFERDWRPIRGRVLVHNVVRNQMFHNRENVSYHRQVDARGMHVGLEVNFKRSIRQPVKSRFKPREGCCCVAPLLPNVLAVAHFNQVWRRHVAFFVFNHWQKLEGEHVRKLPLLFRDGSGAWIWGQRFGCAGACIAARSAAGWWHADVAANQGA